MTEHKIGFICQESFNEWIVNIVDLVLQNFCIHNTAKYAQPHIKFLRAWLKSWSEWI